MISDILLMSINGLLVIFFSPNKEGSSQLEKLIKCPSIRDKVKLGTNGILYYGI